jgi:hypothetical protein
MEENNIETLSKRLTSRISTFFPELTLTGDALVDACETGNIFYKSQDILPYIQTALLDEKIVEVELDQAPRVYFTRVHDQLPDLIPTDVDGEMILKEPVYSAGEYLKQMSHVIILPLEPGIGNFLIRNTQKVVLRFFTTAYAVELGTFFQDLAVVRDIPVLRLGFPVIGRLERGAREYRAKVPETLDLKILAVGKSKKESILSKIVNVSVSGVAFSIKKTQQELFKINEVRTFEFVHNGMMKARLLGKVRHISKIRGKKGTEYVCGVQFDLVTSATASKVEKIVTMVQREHLKELYEKSVESGLDLIT